jgi:hypothetical protein
MKHNLVGPHMIAFWEQVTNVVQAAVALEDSNLDDIRKMTWKDIEGNVIGRSASGSSDHGPEGNVAKLMSSS